MKSLYFTGINPEGKLLLGGVFELKDTHGVPMDVTYDMCKEKGWVIDYCELLCSAWLHDCSGFESVAREICLLSQDHLEKWKIAGMLFLEKFPKAKQCRNPIDVFCRYIMSIKRRYSLGSWIQMEG